jgi:hypothetical protein
MFQANRLIFLVLNFASGNLSRHFFVKLRFVFGRQAAPNESEDLELFADDLTNILGTMLFSGSLKR